MKVQIKNCTNYLWLTPLALYAALFCITGCVTHPDPLAGWKPASQNPDQAIVSDYQDYLQKLPPEDRRYAGPVEYYEDGMGQHAVLINIGLNGIAWEHILIYDKNNRRIKTTKYASGHYRS
jgi:hypothetical protein